jgi:hypothetical protein
VSFHRAPIRSIRGANERRLESVAHCEALSADIRRHESCLCSGVVTVIPREGEASIRRILTASSLDVSSYNDYHFAEALESYPEALGKVKRDSDPQLWVETLVDVGRAHEELGVRVEGKRQINI